MPGFRQGVPEPVAVQIGLGKARQARTGSLIPQGRPTSAGLTVQLCRQLPILLKLLLPQGLLQLLRQ
eukprot:4555833-Alexandrium_andersonii.AAC.1